MLGGLRPGNVTSPAYRLKEEMAHQLPTTPALLATFDPSFFGAAMVKAFERSMGFDRLPRTACRVLVLRAHEDGRFL